MSASETITEAEFKELTPWQPYIDDDLMYEIESDCQDHSHGVNRRILIATMTMDSEHYQYENGFLDPGFYNGVTVPMIRDYAPIWRDFGIGEGRPEFRREVDRILTDAPLSSNEDQSIR